MDGIRGSAYEDGPAVPVLLEDELATVRFWSHASVRLRGGMVDRVDWASSLA